LIFPLLFFSTTGRDGKSAEDLTEKAGAVEVAVVDVDVDDRSDCADKVLFPGETPCPGEHDMREFPEEGKQVAVATFDTTLGTVDVTAAATEESVLAYLDDVAAWDLNSFLEKPDDPEPVGHMNAGSVGKSSSNRPDA